MSVRALSWSFALLLPDMAAKAVLHALADHADDAGRCWPSIKRIAQWAGCNEKTARKALQRVVEIGAVKREERRGTSDIFTIQFDWTPPKIGTTKNDPSQIREVPKSAETPPKNDPDPSLFRETNRHEPSRNRQLVPKDAHDAKPHRLPSDWRPSQACRDFAAERGLDPDSTAEAFVDYWTGGRGAKQQRTDWDRTWRVWCGRETPRAMGQGKFGGFNLPEETMRSMSSSLISHVAPTTTSTWGADGQFSGTKLGPFGIKPGWNRAELTADLALVTEACKGGKRAEIAHEVAKLMVRTKSRAHGEGEARLMAETMVQDLSAYPIDVVRSACQYWVEGGADAKFTPSWPELKELCDKRMDGRLRLKRALEHVLAVNP